MITRNIELHLSPWLRYIAACKRAFELKTPEAHAEAHEVLMQAVNRREPSTLIDNDRWVVYNYTVT